MRIVLRDDRSGPAEIDFQTKNLTATVLVRNWQIDTVALDGLFDEPAGRRIEEVDADDLRRHVLRRFRFRPGAPAMKRRGLVFLLCALVFAPAAMRAAGAEPQIEVVARDPDGHGLLCRVRNKRLLLVQGTPQQMGTAHGRLLGESVRRLVQHVVYLVGAADSIHSGRWFFDAHGGDRAPHGAARRAAVFRRVRRPGPRGRYSAPRCPLRQPVSRTLSLQRRGGPRPGDPRRPGAARRVLDYMRDIDLQDHAAVVVFMPEGGYRWMSLGYAGFIGSVTAMNERGLALGEMGGRGEGDWDGTPMVAAGAADHGRGRHGRRGRGDFRSAPRTCEYYYVLSDRSRAMAALHCTKNAVEVLRPGQQDPRLPPVPDDTVLVSGGDRAKTLGRRLHEAYGRIDVPAMIEIIKRPVAMQSNLHDAIFSPETLEMWFADAGRSTPACDEPYARCRLERAASLFRDEPGGGPHTGSSGQVGRYRIADMECGLGSTAARAGHFSAQRQRRNVEREAAGH